MRDDELSDLDRPYDQVLIPLENPPDILKNPLFVAFDIEDYGIEKTIKVGQGKQERDFKYSERFPLGVTCAFYDKEGEPKSKHCPMRGIKWNFQELVQWIVDCLLEEGIEVGWTLILLSHFSIAEFRHLNDWDRMEKDKRKYVRVGKGDYIHYSERVWVRGKLYEKEISVQVIDTIPYFQLGLDKVAEFINEEKRNLNSIEGKDHKYWIMHMDELLEKHEEKFWWYAEHDSKILLKAFTAFRNFFIENWKLEIVSPWTPTTPAIAATLFRWKFLKTSAAPCRIDTLETTEQEYRYESWIKTNKKKKITIFTGDRDVRYYAMRSYWGGRREAFYRGVKEGDFVFLDFKGHYNRCGQIQPLPNDKTQWKWYYRNEDIERILDLEGFIQCDFRFPENFKYPCLPVKDLKSDRLMFPLEGTYAFFTIEELRKAIKICPELKIIKVWGACGFKPTPKEENHDLKSFLEHFEQMKNSSKKGSLQYHIAKLIGNSLVGKFVQRVDPQGFEEMLDIYSSLEFDREKTANVLSKHRAKDETKRKKKVGSLWAPEWASLILGKARASLGLVFYLSEPITGHTDSLLMENNPEKIPKIIETLANEKASLGIEETGNKFWIMRSSVYILWKDEKYVKEAHHGYPCTSEDFVDLIEKNLEAGKEIESQVHKNSIMKPKSAFRRNIPIGADYLRETLIDWKWDYKRKLATTSELLWKGWIPTIPYRTSEEARNEEMKFYWRRREKTKEEKGAKQGGRGKGRRIKFSKERLYELAEDFRQNLSREELERKYGVSWDTMRRGLISIGLWEEVKGPRGRKKTSVQTTLRIPQKNPPL